MVPVQVLYPVCQHFFDARIIRQYLCIRIDRIGKNHKSQRRIGIGKPEHFKLINDPVCFCLGPDNHRDDDGRCVLRRDRFGKIHFRQGFGASHLRDDPVNGPDAQYCARNQRNHDPEGQLKQRGIMEHEIGQRHHKCDKNARNQA